MSKGGHAYKLYKRWKNFAKKCRFFVNAAFIILNRFLQKKEMLSLLIEFHEKN